MVKLLTFLSTIPNLQVFLLNESECKSYSHFFSKNISVYAIFDDQSFRLSNDMFVLNYWAQIFFLFLLENLCCGYSLGVP